MSIPERPIPAPSPLSEDLGQLLLKAEKGPLAVGEIESALKGRGLELVILVLTVPFLIPSIPGLSAPLGFAVMLLGIRTSLGQRPWLPKSVLSRSIPSKILTRSLKVARAIVKRIESFTRQRMLFGLEVAAVQRIVGLLLGVNGLLLALPLPVPFSNTLPAISIILLTAGAMERDGLIVLAGFVFALLAWGFVIAFILLGNAGLQLLFGS
jgi:hypothetical protein